MDVGNTAAQRLFSEFAVVFFLITKHKQTFYEQMSSLKRDVIEENIEQTT